MASINLMEQMEMNTLQVRQKAKENMIPVLEISMDRVDAIREMAELYVLNGDREYGVPNGNFGDAEISLWEYFTQAYRKGNE